MALINCPECGREISDKAASCPSCGSPIKKADTKIMVKASSSLPLIASCQIFDNNGKEVGKIKPGETFSAKLPADKEITYLVKVKGYFGKAKEMVCEPNTINRFNIAPSHTGMGLNVSRVDIIDSD